MKVSSPRCTTGTLPLTGASSRVAPSRLTSGPSSRTVAGAIVLVSRITVPDATPAASPSDPL